MGDNPTSQQYGGVIDFTSQNIMMNASQMSGGIWVQAYDDSQISVTNSVVETDLTSYTIPPNTLGLNGMARLFAVINYQQTTGSARSATYNIYWGGVKIATFTHLVNSGITSSCFIDLLLKNRNNTALQIFTIRAISGGNTISNDFASAGANAIVSSTNNFSVVRDTKDTTQAQILKVTGVLPIALATNTITTRYSFLESYKAV